jgi:5,6-dimethylbenzimidazole synthase
VADAFSPADIDAVYRVIAQRRDVRHFTPGAIDESVLARILAAAHHAPSVGFMQPWRFIRVASEGVRAALIDLVEAERVQTAAALGERGAEFMRLKVEGIRECGAVLVVALMEGRDAFVFGRRTMPDMDLASVACAIQNMWLASRAEGLGMGWVSLFDPARLATLLSMPDGARPSCAWGMSPRSIQNRCLKWKGGRSAASSNGWCSSTAGLQAMTDND